MSVRFEIDAEEIENLGEKMKMIPDETEQVINDYLHQEAIDEVKRNIIFRMPISKVAKKKPHAKLSKSLNDTRFNLGFEIKPYPRFRYLVFPDQALGTSRNNAPQEFMEKGLEQSTVNIIRRLNEKIDNKIKEVLG